ncbi:MAG: hypothetical protein BGO69_18255 [Bacteroidetes bacterium 46-16]|nr:MAG: hypothetical protein BGO69_18255 [Bacteroidetes bacterium 46-16]
MNYVDSLKSANLVTRYVKETDAAMWLEYCNDPIATEFTNIKGKSPEELAEVFIDFTLKRYEEHRGGLQALIEKETGAFVGMCGLFPQEVNGEEMIEVGYHLLRRYWGKGYATEAAQLFRDWGFENGVADTIVSIIHPDNHKSKKVAMRNGMRLIQEAAEFRGERCDLFGISREEWMLLQAR